ncbi:hypothetical protein DPMN_190947 [Dreissena polymorpha]|uniref:Uncharacterized protein n=1 Tax=Dreissena polymorpha TaxID=45954 RepID=A0A9D3Y3F3_DREPO|nr:hypothetical protein DPMN_190947 [Dreissena polymorpha]
MRAHLQRLGTSMELRAPGLAQPDVLQTFLGESVIQELPIPTSLRHLGYHLFREVLAEERQVLSVLFAGIRLDTYGENRMCLIHNTLYVYLVTFEHKYKTQAIVEF